MYSLGMPVSAIRTKIRQEFEKHRYVAQIKTVDVLLYKSHAEFQVSAIPCRNTILDCKTIPMKIKGQLSRVHLPCTSRYPFRSTLTIFQETLNYWKQLSHVMKYFRPEEDPGARLPRNFVSGFLEGRN